MEQMPQIGFPELVVLLAMGMLLFGGVNVRQVAQVLAEGISKFRGGGPGSPSHPIPADDSKVLNRKRDCTDDKSAQAL